MAKILNRAILIAGERKKVGTPTVTIFELDKSSMVTRASGTATPTDGDAGYAAGCYFHLTSGAVVGGTVYINEGTSASADFNAITNAAGSAGNLNTVYENGSTVTVDTGAIVLNDAQATANTLEVRKTGTGSGNILDFKFENAHTGKGFYLDMDDGIAAVGIHLDNGATARTGADLLVTADSTGTHNVIEINASGSGAATGFNYTNSYNGSPGGNAISLTFDANDGLSTGGILITRGAGIRTDNAIAISDGSTASSDIIDINITGAVTGDIFSIVTSAAATGNAIFLDLDSAVAMTALRVEGSGTRTQPYVELISDSVGSAVYIDIDISGAGSGNVIDIALSTTYTGTALAMDMDAAVGAKAIFLDTGAGTRTDDLIEVTNDGDGNVDVLEINDSNTGSGHVFDINSSGVGSGNVIDITYSAADTGDALKVVMADNVAGGALVITGAGARTDSLVDVVSAETGSMDGMVLLQTTGVFTGHMLTVHSDAAATTGGLIHLDLDAGVAYKAITIDQAGARTVPVILHTADGTFGSAGGGTFLDADISMTGAAASAYFDIDVSGVYTGDIFNVGLGAAATGIVLNIDMDAGVAAQAIKLDAGGGIRTVPLMLTTFDGASDTVGATLWDINVTNTGATAGPLFDIDVTGVYTGNIFDIVFGNASASTGDALHVDMGTNLAGNAIQIDAAGTRTAPLINIANTGADGGTDDHVILITQSGILDSNLIQLTFVTAASTGNGIAINMGAAASANVAGMALTITSEGTGVSGEGSAINVDHSGVLVAGADVVSIKATGAISSTSNALSVTTIGDAGSYGVYISATGSAEALKVDDGNVVFDEALNVAGTLTYATLNDGTTALASTALELNRSADVSTRLMAGGATETVALATHEAKIVLLDTLAGTVVTLPAATGTGAVYRFVVSVVATSNSHVIQVVGTDIMAGMVWLADSDTSGTTTAFVTAVDSDTITLNRTTTGSVTRGEWIELVDAVSGVWLVKGFLTNSGSGATPFSAAV